MTVKRKPGRPRKVGRPRKRRVRRRANQPGGQLGALAPLAKIIGPLLLAEAAKVGISAISKKIRGKGAHGGRRGMGLKLAGQGHRRHGRKPGPKRRRIKNVILPFGPGLKFPLGI